VQYVFSGQLRDGAFLGIVNKMNMIVLERVGEIGEALRHNL